MLVLSYEHINFTTTVQKEIPALQSYPWQHAHSSDDVTTGYPAVNKDWNKAG